MRRGTLICLVLLSVCLALAAGPAGAQESAGDLIILLSSPAEGETFYTAPGGFRLSMPIAGQVVSYDAPLRPEAITVTLELFGASGELSSITVPLDARGYFNVRASMLSRERPWPSDDPHVEMICGECHRADVELALPVDVTHLVVSARSTDGRSGHAVRSLTFDYGTLRDLAVTISGLPAASPGAQVTASTLIYQWRRRAFFGAAVDGQAALTIEGLAHADLVYEVSLVPVILDETLYSAPAQTVVVPAGHNPPPVTLRAQPVRGSITGRVVAGLSTAPVPAAVTAVNLRTGAAQTVTADQDGRFTFDSLPVAEHLLLARAPGGFHLPQHINLAGSPTAETTIRLTEAGPAVLRGRVMLNDQPLPFAQVMVSGLPIAHADPLTGRFELDAVPEGGLLETEVTAAGCYSLIVSSAARDLDDIRLELRPDTRIIDRDGWQLYVPAETGMTEQGGVYNLQNGVFWVRGAGAAKTAPFQVGAFRLEGANADFAVEKAAEGWPRLYVSQGQVLVTRAGEPLSVGAGQTLVLEGEAARPVDLAPGVGALLRSAAGPVARFVPAPSAEAQRSAQLSSLLVGAAQVFMLLALLISFAILPGALLVGGFYYLYAYRRTSARTDDTSRGDMQSDGKRGS